MANPLLRVDVTDVIAQRRFGRFQLEVVALCTLAMFADGYNTQAIGYAAPAIARALVFPPAAFAPVFTLGALGSLLGILLLAPLADRIGRRPVILGSLLLFSATSFATIYADSLPLFMVLRFVTGLGLGGVLPNALALTAEFMPRKHKITLTTIVWVGYSVGAGMAGPIVASLGPRYGWEAVFLFGGLLALVITPILWTVLPESPFVLIRRGDRAGPEIRATLMRISKRYDFLRTTEYVSTEADERGLAVLRLFANGRAPFTVLLWLAFFMNLMGVFFLNGGLGSVFANAGIADDAALVVVVLAQFGGIVGGFVVASLADRLDRFTVLAASFLLSALSIAAIGAAGGVAPVAVLAIIAAVFFTMGTQNAANAVVAASYPTAILATGIGWALGVGRTGQIVAPLVAGLPLHGRFYLYAVPGLVAAAASFLIARAERRSGLEARHDGRAARQAEQSFRGVHDRRDNARRLEHLASLGLDLQGKRVLEVGAGAGELTGFFLDRDATVTSTEPRPENCRLFAETLRTYRSIGYAKAANCTLVTADIEGIDRRIAATFEIVFCYGLLYHLADPEAALAALAKRCSGLFLLETCVAFGDHEAINPVDPDRNVPSQSFEGRGCRPTRPWIFNRLKSLYPHVYVPRTQPAHEEFPLDWAAPPPASGFTRAVFVASRQPLSNPVLLDALPARQERC